ncbi:hypothetical protein Pelo_4334 [Pelomyxa schiedti]|nr:hypothetical protein Pelo_4334 [Pelomyxa schiedti]
MIRSIRYESLGMSSWGVGTSKASTTLVNVTNLVGATRAIEAKIEISWSEDTDASHGIGPAALMASSEIMGQYFLEILGWNPDSKEYFVERDLVFFETVQMQNGGKGGVGPCQHPEEAARALYDVIVSIPVKITTAVGVQPPARASPGGVPQSAPTSGRVLAVALDRSFTADVVRLMENFCETSKRVNHAGFDTHVSWLAGGLVSAVRGVDIMGCEGSKSGQSHLFDNSPFFIFMALRLLEEVGKFGIETEQNLSLLNEVVSTTVKKVFSCETAQDSAVSAKDASITSLLGALRQGNSILFDEVTKLLDNRCTNTVLLQKTFFHYPENELKLQILCVAFHFEKERKDEMEEIPKPLCQQVLSSWHDFFLEQFIPRVSVQELCNFVTRPPVLYRHLSSKMPPKMALSTLQGAVNLFERVIKTKADLAEETRDLAVSNIYWVCPGGFSIQFPRKISLEALKELITCYHKMLDLTCPAPRDSREKGNPKRMATWWYWLEWIISSLNLEKSPGGEAEGHFFISSSALRQCLLAPFWKRTQQYGLQEVRGAMHPDTIGFFDQAAIDCGTKNRSPLDDIMSLVPEGSPQPSAENLWQAKVKHLEEALSTNRRKMFCLQGKNLEMALTVFQKGVLELVELDEIRVDKAVFIANGAFGSVNKVRVAFLDQRRKQEGPALDRAPKEVALKMMFNYNEGPRTVQQKPHFEREYEVAVMHPHWCFTNVFNHFRGDTSLTLIGEKLRDKFALIDEDGNWISGCKDCAHAIPIYKRTTFMTMELAKGTLQSLILSKFKSPEPQQETLGRSSEAVALQQHALCTTRDVLQLAFCVLCAVDHLNSRGWFHCDIKSDNVLLMERPHIKGNIWALCDLGTTIFCQDGNPLVLPPGETFTGNRQNRSPEVIQPDVPGNFPFFKNDVWAVGCLLFEALSGRHPFLTTNALNTPLIRDANLPPLIPRHSTNFVPSNSPPVDLDAAASGLVGWLLERECSRRPTSREALLACGALLSLPLPLIARFLTELHRQHPRQPAAPPPGSAAAPAAPIRLPAELITELREALYSVLETTVAGILQSNNLQIDTDDVVQLTDGSTALQATVAEVIRLVYCNMALRDVVGSARTLFAFLDAASSPAYNLNLLLP